MIKDIWKQPVEGYSADSIGRTEEQILEKEAIIGFKFPKMYRAHMKIQNGGYVIKRGLQYNDQVKEFLCNGATIDPILDNSGDHTLQDFLLGYIDEEELENIDEYEFLDLTRLPILSSMDGHRILCFDYGYNVEHEYDEPQICLFDLEDIENGFEEMIRIKSYGELIHNMVYYGYESTSYFIGLKTNASIDEIAATFFKNCKQELEAKVDDHYGWYNFEKWYCGLLNFNPYISAHIKITPNKFLSGTYLLQEHEEYLYIMDIELRTGADSLKDNSNELKTLLIEEKIKPFLNAFDWAFLLIPFYVENPEELEIIKQTLS